MKLKRFLLPIFSLAFIVAATAFTQTKKLNSPMISKNITTEYAYYFTYVGPQPVFSFSDYTDPNNYVFLSSQNPSGQCAIGNDAVCLILCERFWDGFEWKPDFSYNPGYGSAYWGLSNWYSYGYTGTTAVRLKNL